MIATNDIDQAQREAAKDLAHSMCIDKIKQLSEDLAAANRRNVKHQEALDYIAQGSYTGASHIAMDALGLI